jgi:hypothetical protein
MSDYVPAVSFAFIFSRARKIISACRFLSSSLRSSLLVDHFADVNPFDDSSSLLDDAESAPRL